MLTNNKIYALTLTTALITITTALIIQWNGYKPCQLCLQGRYIWYLIIITSPVFLLLNDKFKTYTLTIITIGLIANTLFSIYHAGIEWNWWQGPNSCSNNSIPNFNDIFSKPIPCNKPAITIFNLSLASYNAILSLALATFIGTNLCQKK